MALPLNFPPNYTLLRTFSSRRVPKQIQSPTCFPPSLSQTLPLSFLETANSPYPQPLLAAFFASCFRGLFGCHPLRSLSEEKLFCVCIPAILASCHPSHLALTGIPATWIYYSTPYWLQSSAKPLLIHNRVLNIFTPGSQISRDHTLIILFRVTTFFTCWVPCPPIQPI